MQKCKANREKMNHILLIIINAFIIITMAMLIAARF